MKDPSFVWKVFKTPKPAACPVEMAAQSPAFNSLMGAQPAEVSTGASPVGVTGSALCDEAECLNADITAEELLQNNKRLKAGKSPGLVRLECCQKCSRGVVTC